MSQARAGARRKWSPSPASPRLAPDAFEKSATIMEEALETLRRTHVPPGRRQAVVSALTRIAAAATAAAHVVREGG